MTDVVSCYIEYEYILVVRNIKQYFINALLTS